MGLSENIKSRVERNERLKKRQKIRSIIEEVLANKFFSGKDPADSKQTQNLPRVEYMSPEDRSSYNYGYMEMGETFKTRNEG